MARPGRPQRAGPGPGNGGGQSKLHSLIGSIWGGQSVNNDFANPGGHDWTDAAFDASAQNPFTKQNFFDRLAGRPDLNNTYALNRATAAGALSDEQKLALFHTAQAHQEQDYQRNKVGIDLANLNQQQNAGVMRPPLSAPSMHYDLASGTPEARPALVPMMSPEEYKYMLGSQAATIGIPGAQANNALAINSRIGSEAERPFVAPTSAATAEGNLSNARRGAMEASYGLGYRSTPQGRDLFTGAMTARDMAPMQEANQKSATTRYTEAETAQKPWTHIGNGAFVNTLTGQMLTATPGVKPGTMEIGKDAQGKMTVIPSKGTAPSIEASSVGTVSNPATGFSYSRNGTGGNAFLQPSAGLPFPQVAGGFGAGPADAATIVPVHSMLGLPAAAPLAPTAPVLAPSMSLDLPSEAAAPAAPLAPVKPYGPMQPSLSPAMDPYEPFKELLRRLKPLYAPTPMSGYGY